MEQDAKVKAVVPFLAVSNMAASIRYYVDGLGFTMTQQWVDAGKLRWCRLEHGGAAIMLPAVPTTGHDSWVPSGKVGEGVTIYFICEDAVAIYHLVTARGIQAKEPIVGNGMWSTSSTDPDGYKIAFESETEVPEDTRLSTWAERNI